MDAQTRTMTGRAGNEHEYMITPLKPSQNLDLALEILACVSKPGARLIGLAAQKHGLDVEAEEAFADLDLGELGADAESTFRSLAKRPKLVRRLFEGTFRDSHDMSDNFQFDEAYAGNYGEMYKALKTIVDVNGLIPFLDTLGN